MKNSILITFLLFNIFAFGQINVGPKLLNVPQSILGYRKTNFIPSDITALQNSKTYFVYREADLDNMNELKKQLSEAWKLTELSFISFDDYVASPLEENASYFTVSGLHYQQNGSSSIYLYLTLNMQIDGQNKIFSRIDLHPNYEAMSRAMSARTDSDKAEFIKYMYSSESQIYNWNLLFLKNSLQFINSKLEKSELFWMFETNEYKNMEALKTKTLYIPDYALIRFGAFSGGETQKQDVNKLLKKYPYPYKVVTIKELEKLVQESSNPIYYLSYVRCNIDKYVTVFEAKTGDMMYYNYTKVSYNLKNDDFKKLKKAVKKSK